MSAPVTATRKNVTEREREALALLARGHGYREIGELMGITHHGVNMLLRRAYDRLGVVGHLEAFRALGWLRVPA